MATAAELVNRASAEELAKIFWEFGDERESRRFARAMSRHISGEPAAIRVVSLKPFAQTSACSLGCAGLNT